MKNNMLNAFREIKIYLISAFGAGSLAYTTVAALTVSDWSLIVGMFCTLLSAIAMIYYRHKDHKLRERELEAKLEHRRRVDSDLKVEIEELKKSINDQAH